MFDHPIPMELVAMLKRAELDAAMRKALTDELPPYDSRGWRGAFAGALAALALRIDAPAGARTLRAAQRQDRSSRRAAW